MLRLILQNPPLALLILVLVLPPAAAAAAATPATTATTATTAKTIDVDPVRLQLGDDVRWAEPGFDDSTWQQLSLIRLPLEDSLRWFRARVELDSSHTNNEQPLSIRISMLASWQLYWDGELLAENGLVGVNRAAEVPGLIDSQVFLPPALSQPGVHLLALRTSSHHRGFDPRAAFYSIRVGGYPKLSGHSWLNSTALVNLSALLLAAVTYLTRYLLDRKRLSELLGALLCAAVAALLLAESWRRLAPYSYDWHLVRLLTVTALSALVCGLLMAFLVHRLPQPGGALWWTSTAALIAAATLVPSYDAKAFVMFLVTLIAAQLWTLRAARARQPGSWLMAAGIAGLCGTLALRPLAFLDHGFFFAFALLVLYLFIAHAWASQQERDRRQAAELESTRLEIELLRRQLQPHFLLNTLSALLEWVEQEPEVAARLIKSLARELSLLDEVSKAQTVDLATELALCRSHLEVMEGRTETRYRIEAKGVDTEARLPPAIFHTLVENALTHNRYRRPEVLFQLRVEAVGDRLRYCFDVPLERPGGDSSATPGRTGTGTGLRYIRARLREAYGEAATISHGAQEDVWRTLIELPRDPADASLMMRAE